MSTPKRYEILRQVMNNSLGTIPMPERPKQVWTIISEQRFEEIGLKHNDSAFIEDSMHDWDWRDGEFRFYPHSTARGDRVDVIIVYER